MDGLLNRVKGGLPDVLKFSKHRQVPVIEEVTGAKAEQERLNIEERWEIARDEFEYDSRLDGGSLLGNGATGYVFKGIWHHFDVETPVAIKVIDRLQHYNSLKLEFPIWKSLNYPFVLPLLGVCITDSHYYLLSPLCAGNLGKFIHQMTETSKIEVSYQIAHGMRYLHSKGILHRDLKTQNILYCDDGTIRICDFGVSKHMMSDISSGCGTYGFMPMEAIMGKWDKPSDVFSYGMVLYHIFTGELPYANMMNVQILHDMMAGGINRPDPGTQVRPEIAELIKMCWDNDVSRRPTFDDCCWRLNDIMESLFKEEVKNEISEMKQDVSDQLLEIAQDTAELKEDVEYVKQDIDELAAASQAHSDVILQHDEQIMQQSQDLQQTVEQVMELTKALQQQNDELQQQKLQKLAEKEEVQESPEAEESPVQQVDNAIQQQLNELKAQLLAAKQREDEMKDLLNKIEENQQEIRLEKEREPPAAAPADEIEQKEGMKSQEQKEPRIEGEPEGPGPSRSLPPLPPPQEDKPSVNEKEYSAQRTRHYIAQRAVGRIVVPKRIVSDPSLAQRPNQLQKQTFEANVKKPDHSQPQPQPQSQPQPQPQSQPQPQPQHQHQEAQKHESDLSKQIKLAPRQPSTNVRRQPRPHDSAPSKEEIEGEPNVPPIVGESPVIKTETEGSVASWMQKFETLDSAAQEEDMIINPTHTRQRSSTRLSPNYAVSPRSDMRSAQGNMNTWKCSCKWENNENRTLCKVCYQPRPRKSIDNSMRPVVPSGVGQSIRCVKCKLTVTAAQKFCKQCGNRLSPATTEMAPSYSDRPTSMPFHRRPKKAHKRPPPTKSGGSRAASPKGFNHPPRRRRANSGFQGKSHGRRRSAASQFWEDLQRSKSPPANSQSARKCRCGCLVYVKDMYKPYCRDCGHKH